MSKKFQLGERYQFAKLFFEQVDHVTRSVLKVSEFAGRAHVGMTSPLNKLLRIEFKDLVCTEIDSENEIFIFTDGEHGLKLDPYAGMVATYSKEHCIEVQKKNKDFLGEYILVEKLDEIVQGLKAEKDSSVKKFLPAFDVNYRVFSDIIGRLDNAVFCKNCGEQMRMSGTGRALVGNGSFVGYISYHCDSCSHDFNNVPFVPV